MLLSPKELNAAAKLAAEQNAANDLRAADKRAQSERLRKNFESACIAAALERKTRVSFDSAVSKVVDLGGFAYEEIKRDEAREKFLASKMSELEGQVTLKIEGLVSSHPALVAKVFPNRLARDFRGLIDKCVNQDTAEDVVEIIKKQLRQITSFSSESWAAFEGNCLGLASDRLLLEAVRIKHAKIAVINAAIPDGLNTALKISWDAAVADFGKAGVLTANKLKWISAVWPRWERHFNADIERAAANGQTSRTWLFWSAGFWGEDDSFVVDVEGVLEPDVNSMSYEERRIHFYWKEIEERNGKAQRYDEEEGILIGVHPLPVAEIFASQGFHVAIEELADEDGTENVGTREIGLSDLDRCSVDLNYQLQVSWGSK